MADAAPDTSNTSLNSLITSTVKSSQATADKLQKKLDTDEAAAEKLREQVKAERPELPKYPDFPVKEKPPHENPWHSFAVWGTLALLVASAFTQAPMLAAFAAVTGALNGYKQKQLLKAKQAEDDYIDAIDKWKIQVQTEHDRYMDTYERYKEDEKEATAQLTADASYFGAEKDLLALRMGGLSLFLKVQEMKMRASRELGGSSDRVVSFQLKRAAFGDWLKKNPGASAEQAQAKWKELGAKSSGTGGDTGAMVDQAVDQIGSLITRLKKDPSLVGASGVYRRTKTMASQIPGLGGLADPNAVAFNADLESLKAQMIKPLLGARYFSGPAEKAMDELLKGEKAWDDPTTVLKSLQTMQRILKSKQDSSASATVSGASYDSPEAVKAAVASGDLDRDDAIKILKDQFGYGD